MRRLVYTVSYLGLIVGLINTAQAQNCKQVPSCSSLGYTRAAGSCPVGVTVLTCPFDSNYIYCPEDCRLYPLNSATCDTNKGVCTQCGDADYWRYESCNDGYYKNNDDCVANECTNFPSTSSSITGCSTTATCKKGASTVYRCSSCSSGYYANNNVCAENACDGYNSASSSIDSCTSVDSCKKGTTTVYTCSACASGYTLKNGICQFAVQNFAYTGGVQSVTLTPGTYKLEVWGAQGGSGTASATPGGGKGGYSYGLYKVTSNTKVYVVVGGSGGTTEKGYNGGGIGYNRRHQSLTSDDADTYGGGATHIATRTGVLSSLSSYKSSILIVAGGGGSYADGGYGGGASGGSAAGDSFSDDCAVIELGGTGGGSQSGGGYGSYGYADWTINPSECSYGDFFEWQGYYGSFGQGGNSDSSSGGGGGYYGGGGGCGRGGGGGSGYVNTTYLTSASTIAGNSSMPSTSGGTETGHSGNGYARITLQ